MRSAWGIWVCGVVLGAAAGFVCGHVAAWSRVESPTGHHFSEMSADVGEVVAAPELQASEGPVYFPDRLPSPPSRVDDPQMRYADATLERDEEKLSAVTEPAELPPPADAAPLSDSEQDTLRAVLESELADLAPADRDIWLDALDGMPPKDAIGVVRLWKKFGGGPGLVSKTHTADAPAETKIPSILLPTPNAPASMDSVSAVAPAARTSLREARRIVIHNLLNSETIGFRRIEPILGCPPLDPQPHPTGLKDAGVLLGPSRIQNLSSRLDHTYGQLVETANALDLAIDGPGFFVVTDSQQRQFFTRCGRFSRDDDGRLVLRTPGGEFAVQPEIVVPDDCSAVAVSLEGEVAITREGGSPETIGSIELAMFVAPAQLTDCGDALYSSTGRSGAPQIGRPNDGLRGGAVQQHLERSNVNVLVENALLQKIDEWLELIDESSAVEPARAERR